MAKCRLAMMFATDGSRSLLGHDNEPAIQPQKEDIVAHNFNRRRLIGTIILFLMPLIALFILIQLWQAEFYALGPTLAQHPHPAQEPGHERDVKWFLHPEDHVSRDPVIRRLSWNITKATMAPNGVKKDVYLINGTSL